MRLPYSLLVSLPVVSLLGGGSAGAESPVPVAPFLEEHCYTCHDEDVSKGDLDLTELGFEPGDASNFAKWQRVFERVRDGEMPPKEKARPGMGEVEGFLAGLREPLMEADVADVKVRGRVRGRRLTRTEYENTLHDLLGIDVPLKDLLPGDPASHGFETVADGQQLSHHHLARYLDAADRALEEAFRRAALGDEDYKEFHTPDALAKRTPGNYRGPDLRDGESIVWPIGLQFFGRFPVTAVPADGWYRITLKGVRAVNPGKGGAVWGSLNSGVCYSNAPVLYRIGTVEAAEEARDLVYEAWVRAGHILQLIPDDGELKRAPNGASGGNVSFKGRDLKKEGYSGIAQRGIEIERIYPNADRERVRERLFGKRVGQESVPDKAEVADRLVARFAEKAFRRPVEGAQLAPYQGLAREAIAEGGELEEALRISYRAILCSPRFLTFVEAPGELDDHAMASRLSYALWVSMPDDELGRLAGAGRLRDPGVLAGQVGRMLADRKAGRFIAGFTDQWLDLKEIDFTTPDRRQFPKFDAIVQESMVAETRLYFADLIENDLGVGNLVDGDFAYLNGRLARHYGIEVPVTAGGGMQRMALSEAEKGVRGGLLGQGAVLKVTADGTSTSPVVRGVFINERLLGEVVPPPPPNTPGIEPDIRGATTIREQLDKHRSNTSCYACHIVIDPPGLALESFDPVGQWRTRYGIGGKGKPVDPAGSTPDGEEFADVMGWKRIYRERGGQLARAFAGQFLTYGTGAPMRFSDQEVLDAVVTKASESGFGVRSIIQAAIASPVFLNK